jgi:hypothetical protein
MGCGVRWRSRLLLGEDWRQGMAIYHNRTGIVGRQAKDKAGKPIAGKQVSTLAKAAYRSGDRLIDERIDKTFDYRSRSHETVQTGILAPDNSPSWLVTNEATEGPERKAQAELRENLWNTIETVEKRKDSQLAREFELALPIELDEAERLALLREWCQSELVSKGFVVDYAVHRSKDGENPQAHVPCAMRPVDAASETGFGKKPDMAGKFTGRGIVGDGAKADLNDWRETWAVAQNKALEQAGFDSRVDHRTLEAQGVERIPQTHKGVSAVAMEKKGMATVRGEAVRHVKRENSMLAAIRDVVTRGEVTEFQQFDGLSWWERMLDSTVEMAGAVIDKAVSLLWDETSGGSWVEREEMRRGREKDEPDLEPG